MDDVTLVNDFAGVALLAEGVDRNETVREITKDEKNVALLAEGVDRNYRKQIYN